MGEVKLKEKNIKIVLRKKALPQLWFFVLDSAPSLLFQCSLLMTWLFSGSLVLLLQNHPSLLPVLRWVSEWKHFNRVKDHFSKYFKVVVISLWHLLDMQYHYYSVQCWLVLVLNITNQSICFATCSLCLSFKPCTPLKAVWFSEISTSQLRYISTYNFLNRSYFFNSLFFLLASMWHITLSRHLQLEGTAFSAV